MKRKGRKHSKPSKRTKKTERDHIKTLILLTERYITGKYPEMDAIFINQLNRLKHSLKELK